jgi:hypothetical protein
MENGIGIREGSMQFNQSIVVLIVPGNKGRESRPEYLQPGIRLATHRDHLKIIRYIIYVAR